ncbi:hypothetical protein JXB01_03240 [Candidatus Micrarchaeota archaeon]|nr:hypothetical protein [Candidatus Micrarchaeota archaeon]
MRAIRKRNSKTQKRTAGMYLFLAGVFAAGTILGCSGPDTVSLIKKKPQKQEEPKKEEGDACTHKSVKKLSFNVGETTVIVKDSKEEGENEKFETPIGKLTATEESENIAFRGKIELEGKKTEVYFIVNKKTNAVLAWKIDKNGDMEMLGAETTAEMYGKTEINLEKFTKYLDSVNYTSDLVIGIFGKLVPMKEGEMLVIDNPSNSNSETGVHGAVVIAENVMVRLDENDKQTYLEAKLSVVLCRTGQPDAYLETTIAVGESFFAGGERIDLIDATGDIRKEGCTQRYGIVMINGEEMEIQEGGYADIGLGYLLRVDTVAGEGKGTVAEVQIVKEGEIIAEYQLGVEEDIPITLEDNEGDLKVEITLKGTGIKENEEEK